MNIVLSDEIVFMGEVADFLSGFGAKKDYDKVVNTDGSIVFYFNNPGWSIERTTFIYDSLYSHMVEYCESNGVKNILGDVSILII